MKQDCAAKLWGDFSDDELFGVTTTEFKLHFVDYKIHKHALFELLYCTKDRLQGSRDRHFYFASFQTASMKQSLICCRNMFLSLNKKHKFNI